MICILKVILLSADVFENFRKMCLKVFHLDTVSSWISMPSSFKKGKSKTRIMN